MKVHCSMCGKVESISTANLEPRAPLTQPSLPPNLLPVGDEPVQVSTGIPYDLKELVACIKENLPSWEIDLEEDNGTTSVKTICPKHFPYSRDLLELVERHKGKRQVQNSLLSSLLLPLYQEFGYAKLQTCLNAFRKASPDE